MHILELTKTKIKSKDIVNIGCKYYEAKRLKQYLQACRGLKLDITICPKERTLNILHDSGEATFNPVAIDYYKDAGNVTYISHPFQYKWNNALDCGRFEQTKKAVTGTAHEFTLNGR